MKKRRWRKKGPTAADLWVPVPDGYGMFMDPAYGPCDWAVPGLGFLVPTEAATSVIDGATNHAKITAPPEMQSSCRSA